MSLCKRFIYTFHMTVLIYCFKRNFKNFLKALDYIFTKVKNTQKKEKRFIRFLCYLFQTKKKFE